MKTLNVATILYVAMLFMRLQENYKSQETLVTGYNIEISVEDVGSNHKKNER